ncbi:MAG: hypothetical protein ACYC7E_21150, partial [Armatimonadota bacterium]
GGGRGVGPVESSRNEQNEPIHPSSFSPQPSQNEPTDLKDPSMIVRHPLGDYRLDERPPFVPPDEPYPSPMTRGPSYYYNEPSGINIEHIGSSSM